MKTTVFFILAILSCTVKTGISQTTDFIRGTLKDKKTNTPIEYASIGITNSLQGTAANENGEFILNVGYPSKSERLKISCIGYLTKTLSIDSLMTLTNDNLTICLVPDIALLDEVVVKSAPINPAEIIKLAVNSIDINYAQQPFNLELFSIINANDSVTGKSFKIETVLFGYYRGYHSSGIKKFEIIHKRTTGEDPLKTIDYGYWPSFEILQADLLTDPTKRGVLNLSLLDDFKFRYAGVSIYENDTVYNIEYYAPKPNEKITGYGIVPKTYKGNIYITTNTHAIVRHEIVTNAFAYHVIYKKVNDKYFPFYFSGLRTNEFKLPGGKRAFKTKNVITVSKIILENIKPIDSKANEYNVNKIQYDKKFWSENHPVKEQ